MFCVHETVVLPEPLPLVGLTEIQEPLPVAVQLPPVHPEGCPVIVTTCEPLLQSGSTLVGVIVKLEHGVEPAAAWFTVNGLPAMITVSERAAPVFSVHETVVDPEPLPLVGVTEIQDPLPEAVQFPPVHPEGCPVIVTNCEPLLLSGFALSGLMMKLVQVAPA